jgi:myo-inositol-1(or 4)-monophosphatase
MSPDLKRVALKAARAAGRIHLERLRHFSVRRKSNPLDLVTEADHEAEAAIIAIIAKAFPSHAILAEESGLRAGRGAHRWIIDPLDGTTNFVHGFPQFCVSIAYERSGVVRLGVIYDAVSDECFFAEKGTGATLNGRPIRVSPTDHLASALLATGFPYDRRKRRRFYLAFWEAFMMRVHGVRRAGSAALDLAYVACGRLDAFWEFGLKPWDVAAGALIVNEAGGRVTNMDGSEFDPGAGEIVASNRLLHSEMLATIAENWSEAKRRQAELDQRVQERAL